MYETRHEEVVVQELDWSNLSSLKISNVNFEEIEFGAILAIPGYMLLLWPRSPN